MRVQIKDLRVFDRINSADLAGYLRSQGWQESIYREDHSSIWVNTYQSEKVELLLPLNRRFADYGHRMADAVGLLAAMEGRSQLAVLEDIQTSGMDVVRFQLISEDVHEGTVSVDRGVAMFEGIPELFSASASSTQQPRFHFPTKKTRAVSEYLRTLRFGQTEIDSYVIRVLSPVPPGLPGLFDPADEPFERRVMQTLFRGLAAVNLAAERALQGGRGNAFEESVSQGVSANLCEALVNITGQDTRSNESLAIRLVPARNRPLAEAMPTRITIAGDRIPIIREAARLLKSRTPLQDQEIQGYVVKLQTREEGGVASISTFIDSQPRKVTVALNEEEHKKAIQAYEQRVEIICRGDLSRSGQAWSLANPGPITILDE